MASTSGLANNAGGSAQRSAHDADSVLRIPVSDELNGRKHIMFLKKTQSDVFAYRFAMCLKVKHERRIAMLSQQASP